MPGSWQTGISISSMPRSSKARRTAADTKGFVIEPISHIVSFAQPSPTLASSLPSWRVSTAKTAPGSLTGSAKWLELTRSITFAHHAGQVIDDPLRSRSKSRDDALGNLIPGWPEIASSGLLKVDGAAAEREDQMARKESPSALCGERSRLRMFEAKRLKSVDEVS